MLCAIRVDNRIKCVNISIYVLLPPMSLQTETDNNLSPSPFQRPFSTQIWLSRWGASIQDFIGAKDDRGVVITGAVRRAKFQIVITNKLAPSCLQAGCPSCRPTNSVEALKEKRTTITMQILKVKSPCDVCFG